MIAELFTVFAAVLDSAAAIALLFFLAELGLFPVLFARAAFGLHHLRRLRK